MKVKRENRTLVLTDIPTYDGRNYTIALDKLSIAINIVDGGVQEAIVLDNIVIPAIVEAVPEAIMAFVPHEDERGCTGGNMALIAAAPVLLEACIQARAALPDVAFAKPEEKEVIKLLNHALSLVGE